MKRLNYVEDYIDLLAKHHQLTWPPVAPLIKLARYDEPIVAGMAEQLNQNTGFTDKQAELAHKIVMKYRKQWTGIGYDVEHLSVPKYRLPIRKIDRRKIVDIKNNQIQLRFPYDQDLISKIRAAVNDIPGSLFFDREQRAWCAAMIEPRIVWAKEFGCMYQFDFTEEFDYVLNTLLSQKDYSIELVRINNEFKITNAHDSLLQYIDEHGGLVDSNLLQLLDLSGICCYSVNPSIFNELKIDDVIRNMLTSRELNLLYGQAGINFQPAIEYAKITNRFPIYVYENGHNAMRKQLDKYFSATQIVERKNTTSTNDVIYFNHWKYADEYMPLLLTTHTLMIGNRRLQMLHAAEKVFYYTQEIVPDNAMSAIN